MLKSAGVSCILSFPLITANCRNKLNVVGERLEKKNQLLRITYFDTLSCKNPRL